MIRRTARSGFIVTGIAGVCVIAVALVAGCGKSDSDKPTKAEITSFKGHQPTAEQLHDAMSKASRGAAPPAPAGPPK